MVFELPVGVVVVAAHGGLLESSIHPFNLTVGPRMVRLSEAMLDAMFAANTIEHVKPVARGRT